jgi:hypothetical protein
MDDSGTRIESFTDNGKNKVEKLLSSDFLNVAYKKILPPPTFQLLMNDASYNHNYTSNDGLIWTQVAHLTNSPVKPPYYYNGYWWLGNNDQKVYKSSDRVNWTAASGVLSSMGAVYNFCSNGQNIVGWRPGDNYYAFSTNGGTTWTQQLHSANEITGINFLPDGRMILCEYVDAYPDDNYCLLNVMSAPGVAPTSTGYYYDYPERKITEPFWWNNKLHFSLVDQNNSDKRIVYVDTIPGTTFFSYSGVLLSDYSSNEWIDNRIYCFDKFYILLGTPGDTVIMDNTGALVGPSGLLIFDFIYNSIDQKIYTYSGESGGLYRGRVHSSPSTFTWTDVTDDMVGGPTLEYGTFRIGTRA